MESFDILTLGEIVKRNFRAADVLERFSLDFCCKGGQGIAEACASRGIDPEPVKRALSQLDTGEAPGEDVSFDTWSLAKLADYIVHRHHAFVEAQIPKIKGYLEKVSQVHGDRYPELLEIREIFNEVAGELTVHMKKEELMLFPYIKKLERASESRGQAQSPLFKTVRIPVEMMKADHADEGGKLARIASLANNYHVPPDGCNTYRVTYELLREFERDLHLHIHLENNILFPKAIALESDLNH